MRDFHTLAARISQLERDDAGRTAYGSWFHHYRLLPPLEERCLAEFERRNEVVLPKEYREFLLRVGSGGAGPGQGLWPLDLGKDRGELLTRPFPFEQFWCPVCCSETREQARARTGAVSLTQGCIGLGSYGDCLTIHLVVSGAARGQIWVDESDCELGIWPDGESCPCVFESQEDYDAARARKRRFTFFDWYENWLDSACKQLAEKKT